MPLPRDPGLRHLAKTLAHGVVGGVRSAASGGKFGQGFLAAGFVQLAAPAIGGIGAEGAAGTTARVIAAAVVGGTASRLGGGKFANGAVTAAFMWMYNHEVDGFGRIDLTEHEGIDGAHTIGERVRKSDAFLARRMNEGRRIGLFTKYKAAHSTFSSLESANSLVSSTLAVNEAAVHEFLHSHKRYMVVHKRFGSPTGRVAYRGTGFSFRRPTPFQIHKGYGVTVVIRRNVQLSHGFVVHSAYPTR